MTVNALLLWAVLAAAGAWEAVATHTRCEYWGVGMACKYNGKHKRPKRCTGLGRRYCDRAHEALNCPAPCAASRCRRVGKSRIRFGEGNNPFTWEDLALAGNYDMVFVDRNEICLQVCWKDPWKAKCDKKRKYDGQKYCASLDCEHDDKNRFVGCHKGKPWHRPTCKECARVFPRACAKQYDFEDDDLEPTLAYKCAQKSDDDDDDDDDDDGDDECARYNKAKNSEKPASSEKPKSSSSAGTNRPRPAPGAVPSVPGMELPVTTETTEDSPDAAETASFQVGAMSPLAISRDFLESDTSIVINAEPEVEDDPNTVMRSFTELSMQMASPVEEVNHSELQAAVAELLTLEPKQVVVVSAVAVDPVLVAQQQAPISGDDKIDAEEAIKAITTVTFVIWSQDPQAIEAFVDKHLDDLSMNQMLANVGVKNYLEESMVAEALVAPEEQLSKVFSQSSMVYGEAKADHTAVIVAVVCSVVAVALLAVVAVLLVKRRQANAKRAAEQAAADAKLAGMEETSADQVKLNQEEQ